MRNQSNENKPAKKVALDDESRVRILSPGRLVIKRFFRNRLAIVGLVIIVSMFVFSFIGGLITPYGETQTFYTYETRQKNFASATINTNLYYTAADGETFNSTAQASFVKAYQSGQTAFTASGRNFGYVEEGTDFYRIFEDKTIATAMLRGDKVMLSIPEGVEISDEFRAAMEEAITAKTETLEYDGQSYAITYSGKEATVFSTMDVSICSKNIFHLFEPGSEPTYAFKYESQKALTSGQSKFEADGQSYTIVIDENGDTVIETADGTKYVTISDIIVTPASGDVFLTVDFKDLVHEAVNEGARQTEFEYTDPTTGETATYVVERKDYQYNVRTETQTQVINLYSSPSMDHWLGTDGNGMDILTRLMYGGRVSLLIGIIVEIMEITIGVLVGGVAGYFGKWVDQILMRIVDIIICIPTMPLYIILGAMMDTLHVDSSTRIYFLILIFGLLGWVGIARMVRGQILSLREQEFMTATEASGLSVGRRIFKHLIPNVVPQLIVYASMGIGDVILSEATLSFLGLGVKFPYASWGNIVNAVNDSYVLTNYLFVWIPAGFLILITVLGYNFVGDGLRDAFDPKMKR